MAHTAATPITITLTTPGSLRAGCESVWTFASAELPPGQFRLVAKSRVLARPVEVVLDSGNAVPVEVQTRREAGDGLVRITLESSATNGKRQRWLGQTQVTVAPCSGEGSIEIAPTVTVGEGGVAVDPSLAIHLPVSASASRMRIAPRLDLGEWGVVDRPSLRVHFEDSPDRPDGRTQTVTLRPVRGGWPFSEKRMALPQSHLGPRHRGVRVQTPFHLCLRSSTSSGSVAHLILADRFTLGRDPASDICLTSGLQNTEIDMEHLSHLSGTAAEIQLGTAGAQLRVLNRNGALLDDQSLGEGWHPLQTRHVLRFPAPGAPFELEMDLASDEALRIIDHSGQTHILWRGDVNLEELLGDRESSGPPISLVHRDGHLWLRSHSDEVTIRHRRVTRPLEAQSEVALLREWNAEGDGWWVGTGANT